MAPNSSCGVVNQGKCMKHNTAHDNIQPTLDSVGQKIAITNAENSKVEIIIHKGYVFSFFLAFAVPPFILSLTCPNKATTTSHVVNPVEIRLNAPQTFSFLPSEWTFNRQSVPFCAYIMYIFSFLGYFCRQARTYEKLSYLGISRNRLFSCDRLSSSFSSAGI